ncbi:hypothetical protein ACGFX4_21825 [Kitasatospora sp. NPDC048365]|uniref:hypothetical protein n=1 Tax=Kitasatospora sp. NPDC048365 TaxID=3364050 RepID=UPI0037203714
MALREHSAAVHGAARNGRHGRPKPFGGRLRLPTLRFSGAAMAMSTVVGISLVTTWLLNEQQQVGRRPGVSVGASPPVPSADADTTATPSAPAEPDRSAVSGSGTATPSLRPTATPTPSHPAVHPVRASGTPLAAGGGVPPTLAAPSTSPSGSPTGAPPSASVPPSPPAVPQPIASGSAAPAMSGRAGLEFLGRSGTRHTLRLTVNEPLAALQVEFRLRRPDALPGTTPATDLPGAVVTVALDRDTLVYRFTVPPDTALPAGTHTFSITGAVPAPDPTAPAETWTASAFALTTPHAVTARGAFL